MSNGLVGVFVITLPLLVLFLARALDGLTGGNVSVANAYLADITSDAERNKNFGKMAVASNLGFVLGPTLAGILGATSYGPLIPVLAALTISLVASLIIGLYLPESRPCTIEALPGSKRDVRTVFGQEHKDCIELRPAAKLTLRGALGLPSIGFLFLLYFLIFLGFNFFYTAFPVHAVVGLHWTITENRRVLLGPRPDDGRRPGPHLVVGNEALGPSGRSSSPEPSSWPQVSPCSSPPTEPLSTRAPSSSRWATA